MTRAAPHPAPSVPDAEALFDPDGPGAETGWIVDRAGAARPMVDGDEDWPRLRPVGALRVLVVTEDDPLYVIEFFRVFFDALPPRTAQVIGITVDRAFHEPILRTLRRMLRFYGPWDTLRLGLRWLRARLTGDTIAGLARARGVAQIETPSVNDPAYLARLRAMRPDLILSVAGPEIFSAELLSIPRLGCINVHTGRLPEYRGMLPSFWQLLRGEREATITVHRMVEALDAGEVLATAEFALHRRDSLDRVIRGTKRVGARLMVEVLERLREGRLEGRPLDMTRARYFRFPQAEDVGAFRSRGHRLL
ncbi:methionyl-tRNA formyltransferase [Albimonas pacifica]|uniref:Methionyl-tRNA formyltransferase n=1 Tax=Albimonas pacifica TaxID=1114924 RepID=A0A1I3IWU3_9RHOB|nr:formyltransferase family protein [Albimonas pacifica]SFI52340.1 methionyl-tRNA formyltransferase [Albimonas pacifica]